MGFEKTEDVDAITFSKENPQEMCNKEDQDSIYTIHLAPSKLEEGGQSVVDDLQEINLEIHDDPKLVSSAHC